MKTIVGIVVVSCCGWWLAADSITTSAGPLTPEDARAALRATLGDDTNNLKDAPIEWHGKTTFSIDGVHVDLEKLTWQTSEGNRCITTMDGTFENVGGRWTTGKWATVGTSCYFN